MSNITLSIIGTVGRDKTKPLTVDHFNYMCWKVNDFIAQNQMLSGLNSLTLVSGGAAWADHVAVCVFLMNYNNYVGRLNLVLYLPCPIEMVNGLNEYYDSGVGDWRVNPGRSSNEYHKLFGGILGRDTIKEIVEAKEKGAVLDVKSKGFHARNTKVSKSDYLIAFTGAPGDKPTGGGTLYTWTKSKSQNKYHFSIENADKLYQSIIAASNVAT